MESFAAIVTGLTSISLKSSELHRFSDGFRGIEIKPLTTVAKLSVLGVYGNSDYTSA